MLFSTPRSGSTLIYRVLAEYFESRLGLPGLEEYFNLKYHSFWDTGSGIASSRFSQVHFVKSSPEAIVRAAIQHRIDLLKKYHGEYFFKLFALQVYEDQFEWFIKNFRFIFVERRNLFEQVTSFMISAITQQWYVPGGVSLEPKSLKADPTVLASFEAMYLKYWTVRNKLEGDILFYEDALENGLESVIRVIDPEYLSEASFQNLPEKQNNGEKLDYFRDPDVMIRMYRDSALNFLYPV